MILDVAAFVLLTLVSVMAAPFIWAAVMVLEPFWGSFAIVGCLWVLAGGVEWAWRRLTTLLTKTDLDLK